VHLGDTFDNKWGNPFRRKQTVRSSFLAGHGFNNIRTELEATVSRLLLLKTLLPAGTTITHEPSNHSDDWMRDWINRGDLHDDPLNSPLLCELWLSVYRALEREGGGRCLVHPTALRMCSSTSLALAGIGVPGP